MIDRTKFYEIARRSLFGGSMSQSQVDGLENLLNVWEEFFGAGSLNELAYDLATAFHETATTMQPIKERGRRPYFNKYEPGTRIGKVLGNTVSGDGYRFRGEGHVQNTGRRNAAKATREINEQFGLDIDLVANPDHRGDPRISAISLFLGNRQGWWTGKKIGDYITSTRADFRNARRIVNGMDKASQIAGYSKKFRAALHDVPIDLPDAPEPVPVPKAKPTTKTTGAAAVVVGGGVVAAVEGFTPDWTTWTIFGAVVAAVAILGIVIWKYRRDL